MSQATVLCTTSSSSAAVGCVVLRTRQLVFVYDILPPLRGFKLLSVVVEEIPLDNWAEVGRFNIFRLYILPPTVARQVTRVNTRYQQ